VTKSAVVRLFGHPVAVAGWFALAGLFLHVLTNGGYGFFRDELYYLDCGEHLDWGYVDHAPLIAIIAKFGRTVFGESLRGIRFLPALAGAAKIFLTGMIARELGGSRFAIALACLCVLVAPIYLGIDTLLSMNVFEPLFWMGCAYVLIAAVNREKPKLLVWFGVLAGLGLEDKHSMLFFGFALVVGLLLTPQRKLLANRWMWVAGAIALLIFLPNLIWEYRHDWATIEDLSNVRTTHKNVDVPPLEFLGQQALILSPVSVFVWGAGLFWLLFDRSARRYRFLGLAYLVLLFSMMLMKGKNYYVAPVYPMLFAAGGLFWERTLAARPRLAWLRIALPAAVVALGLILMPLVLPVLPVERLIRYQDAIGFRPPKTEVGHAGKLPQHFGDMFGWPEMVDTVARVHNGLPADERATAGIFTGNYGEAGAINFFGRRYGLPRAISGHQTYFLWGPGSTTGDVLILLQQRRRDAEKSCNIVEDSEMVGHPYGMAEENYRILICRGLKKPLREIWPETKHWN
jgi:hypothetical protein